ncbi:MAG: hypothetical protein MI824_02715 [Hyphomicrobiales bacterium]|nr:hypothetical protein [Hyphomicrobiales bacterium]
MTAFLLRLGALFGADLEVETPPPMMPELPSRLYRTAVRQVCTQYKPAPERDPEADFHDYLRSCYREETARLAALSAEDADHPERMLSRHARFVFAAGLFAYGHIEVAEDLLDGQPPTGGIRKLVLALKALLPLPDELDPLRDAEAVRGWLRANRDWLAWDEARGAYAMSDGRR